MNKFVNFIKKALVYTRNKLFFFITDLQIKRKAKLKIFNHELFLKKLWSGNEDEKLNIIFSDGFSLECNSSDLCAVAETCVTEDYQKYDSLEIQPGDIVFDIGAHIGSFSIYAATKGALVYAFEPDSVNFKKLQLNITKNKLDTKVKAFNFGIYSYDGTIGMSVSDSNTGGHSSVQSQGEKIKIPVRSLESVCLDLKIDKVDLMKIDIEGSEYEIFDSFNIKLSEIIQKIVGEYHLFPNSPELNFVAIQKSLSPYYKTVKRYNPYNFYATKR